MKLNKITYSAATLALAALATSCDEQIMEWKPSDPTVEISEIPLQLQEQIALYKPIKEYVAQYQPHLNLAVGMGADMYISDEAYKAVVDENFTGVSLGNAMKMGVLMNSSGVLKFETVDAVLASLPQGMKLYGHNLLWHTQQQQGYLLSLIKPSINQTPTPGGGDGINNVLIGDMSDFEGGTTGGWSSWGGNKESAEVVDGAGIDGSKALVLTNKGDGSAWEAQCAFTFDQPLKKDVEYKISFKAKSTSPAGSLQFQYQNGTSYGSQGGYNTFDVGTDWTTCEYIFTITDYDDVDRILINYGAVGGSYTIDNIRFGKYTEPAQDPMENIMIGDMSDFDGGTTGGWSSWGGNKESAEVVDGAGADGSKALVLTNKGDGSAWEAQCAYTFDQPLLKDTPYIIQFQAKSTSAAGQLQFQYQNGTSYGSQGGYHTFDVGTDWTTCEYEFTITDYEDVDRIILNYGAVGGSYTIDNIKFGKKIGGAAAQTLRTASRAKANYVLKTPEEKKAILLEAMEEWIKGVMTHVGDRVDAWDVINEPIADGYNKWRGIDNVFGSNAKDGTPDSAPVEDEETGLNLNWAKDVGNQHWYWGYYIGKEYAVKAFEFARKYAANPDVKLFVNDYNLEVSPAKLAALIDFVNYIDQNGAHVDGIGTQMHVNVNISKEQVDAMFQTLAATGKLVRITELDVAFGTEDGKEVTPSPEQLIKQGAAYEMILKSYLENVPQAQQSAITIWTLSDNKKEHENWLKGDKPNIFDKDYKRKVAYKGVCDAIAGHDIGAEFSGDSWKDLYQKQETEGEE